MIDPRGLPPGLLECRNEIDRIDAEIIRLLSARLTVVLHAAATKRAVGVPFKDEEREEEILDNAGERATDFGLPKKNVQKIFQQILKISEKSQASGD
jgi:chorismate mutase/prephenate dehydratase